MTEPQPPGAWPPPNPYAPPSLSPAGDPGTPWIGGGPPRRRSTGELIAVTLGIVAGIFGLLVVGFIVMFAISLNSWGNNK